MTPWPAAAYWAARLALLQERGGCTQHSCNTSRKPLSRDLLRGYTRGLDYDSGSFSQSLRGGECVGEGFGGLQRVPLNGSPAHRKAQTARSRAGAADSPRVRIEMPQASPGRRGGHVGQLQEGHTGQFVNCWDGVSSGTILVAPVQGSMGEHQCLQTQRAKYCINSPRLPRRDRPTA